MTIAPQAVRTHAATTDSAEQAPLTWTLVHTAPGALVFAAPGLSPRHPLLRHRDHVWTPAGPAAVPAAPGHGAHYGQFVGRVGLLAAALGVGAALVAHPAGVALAEPSDTDAGSSSSSTSSTSTSDTTSTGSSAAKTKSDSSDEKSDTADAKPRSTDELG